MGEGGGCKWWFGSWESFRKIFGLVELWGGVGGGWGGGGGGGRYREDKVVRDSAAERFLIGLQLGWSSGGCCDGGGGRYREDKVVRESAAERFVI